MNSPAQTRTHRENFCGISRSEESFEVSRGLSGASGSISSPDVFPAGKLFEGSTGNSGLSDEDGRVNGESAVVFRQHSAASDQSCREARGSGLSLWPGPVSPKAPIAQSLEMSSGARFLLFPKEKGNHSPHNIKLFPTGAAQMISQTQRESMNRSKACHTHTKIDMKEARHVNHGNGLDK